MNVSVRTLGNPGVRTFFGIFKQKKPDNPSKKKGQYEVITEPGKVSRKRSVPSYIPKPPYANTGRPPPLTEAVEIKTEDQIECLRQSCLLAKRVLKEARKIVKPGITTDFLDKTLHDLIIYNGAYPSPLNYKGFPKSICTSINNVACHGIPDDRVLKYGDIMNIDVTVFLNGYHGDCSEMFEVGEVDEEAKKLIQVTKECLYQAINVCRPDEKFCTIGNVIEEIATKQGYKIMPAFGGHGIGTYFHGPPDIIHTANQEHGYMKPGMTFTIEPVVSQGTQEVLLLDDKWTAVSEDNSLSAQMEHTILITDEGCEILTLG